jgi:8-oxo-dGTP diphosphatase/2-hydroxy-dATP diphosphatase
MEPSPNDRTLTTLCLIERGSEVLLGMKKRGFGAGRWNGFGGKVQPGESIEAAARRELIEECSITAQTVDPIGIFEFFSPGKFLIEMHVFRISDWKGEPEESEEMRPQWFPKTSLPLDLMWPSDRYWLTEALQGRKASGRFVFDANDAVIEHDVTLGPV